MHFDYEKNNVSIEIMSSFSYRNSRNQVWGFERGWISDGHSVGKLFRHFDAWTMAALCHDQFCEVAEKEKSYAIRRTGDKDYKFNLQDLGAPRSTVWRRYAGVTAYARWLKLTGKLK